MLIGLAPMAVIRVIDLLIVPSRAAPRWVWIPATVLIMAWMLAYPVWVTRRRGRLPAPPRPRAFLVEGLFALLAVPVLILVLAGSLLAVSRLSGGTVRSETPFESIAASPNGTEPLALILFAVAVAPLAEEVFFRGMLFNALRRWLHPLLAALVQAVAFGLVHPFNLAGQALVGVSGFCLAMVYQWRKTLLAPILLHGFFNALGMTIIMHEVAVAAAAPVLGVNLEARDGGCRISRVFPGSSAEDAGLRVGDVITALDGHAVANFSEVVSFLRTKHVGDKIYVDFTRESEEHRVEAGLKGRPK